MHLEPQKKGTSMAGYSGTPLAKKLGIKPGAHVLLVRPPESLAGDLEPLPSDVVIKRQARGRLDVVVLFSERRKDLEARFARLAEQLEAAGGLWVAWPKKSSGRATDLAFDVVQGIGLAAGLVDNKVCAVDDTWSGLRFVRRLADR